VVRFQKKDGGFYADAEGYIFQLQSSYSSHVQIVDGHIPLAANSGYKGEITNPEEKKWFNDVMTLINYMENSRMWKDKIVQINVAENGDMTLIPREGKERFIFGYPEDIQEKFEKMELYYTAVIPEKGQDTYSRIDLRYKGQLVCK
jgi:cell division protein FtsQ